MMARWFRLLERLVPYYIDGVNFGLTSETQVRAKEENQRSRDMNAALAAFVEGKSDSADWWHRNTRMKDKDVAKGPADTSTAESRGPRIMTPNARLPPLSRESSDYFDLSRGGGEVVGTDVPHTNKIKPSEHTGESGGQSLLNPDDQRLSESLGSSKPASEGRDSSTDTEDFAKPSTKGDTHDSDVLTKIKDTMSRAAGLIRKGVGADGVLFLDATVGTFGGLIDSEQGLSQTESETDGSLSSRQGRSRPSHREDETTVATKHAETVAHSVVLGSAFAPDIEARVRSAIEQAKISQKILKSLLRRYPNGEIWHFNEEGDASDEDDQDLPTDAAGSAMSEPEVEPSSTPKRKRAGKRARARKRDARAIQGMFTGIRSLAFLGMWDSHQERWFGASIAVSYSPMRIFSANHELSYMAAFCDVVLAEIGRLEAQELGRSKNDFVSSISHELRSPLGTESSTLTLLETC